jgi:hypothetical protein
MTSGIPMSETECALKQERMRAEATKRATVVGLEGFAFMSAAVAISSTTPGADCTPGCEKICDGPVPIERAFFNPARIIGLGRTYDICPATTQIPLSEPPATGQ